MEELTDRLVVCRLIAAGVTDLVCCLLIELPILEIFLLKTREHAWKNVGS